MAGQLDPNVKDDLKTQFVTREGTYRLMTLSEYSRPNRVGYTNSQSSPQVRVSIVSLPNPTNGPLSSTTNCAVNSSSTSSSAVAAAAAVTSSLSSSNGGGGDSCNNNDRQNSYSNSNSNSNAVVTGLSSSSIDSRLGAGISGIHMNGDHNGGLGGGNMFGGDRICFNFGRELYVYAFRGVKKGSELSKPIDKKFYKGINPSCHDFNAHAATPSGAPLLVGFTTGQIQLVQPQPGPRELRKIYNEERLIDKTKVTCLKWLPRSPNLFLASHASGHLYLYNEELPCTPTSPNYQPFKMGDGFTILTCKSKSTRNPLYKWVFGTENCNINEFCFSPCGSNLAIVSQDGFLRVFHYDTMELLGIARSYFGGFLCVCWSPDGKYIVVGGEDDLVTVWSLHERRVVARGQGHRSWVSVVAFDPYTTCYSNWDGGDFSDDENQVSEYSNHRYGSGSDSNHGFECSSSGGGTTAAAVSAGPSTGEKNPTPNARQRPNSFRESLAPDKLAISYRLGSVSQDTQLCLWDITEDVLRHPLTLRQRVNSTNLNETSNNTSNNTSAHLNGDIHDVKLIKPFAMTSTPGVTNGSNPNSIITKDHDSSNCSSKHSSNSSSGKFSTANCTLSSSSTASPANDTAATVPGSSAINIGSAAEIVVANKSNCSNSSNSKPSNNPLKFPNCISATTSDLIDIGSSNSSSVGVGIGNNVNAKSSSGISSTKSDDSNISTLRNLTQRVSNFFSNEKKSSSSSTSSSTSTTTVFDNSQPNNHYNHQNHPGGGGGGVGVGGGRHSSHRKLFKSYVSGNNSSSSNHQTSFMTAPNSSGGCNSIDGNGIGIGGTLKLGSKSSTLQSPTGAIVTSYDPMKLIGTQSCPRFDECPLLEPLVCKKIAHERLTALIFREDCFLTACQDGFIYTWARPAYSSKEKHL
ncbi:WD repeat-containing protein 20 isoform X2 [Eupeodes corollae]|uniref:WD repeat-containing protein 20 isoform X2 n=1 Tax=Eupeodes corollae TaxID=290404 RepID=UPI002490FECA|nr:WD repeat-containing protein 20 isoform X2 [Eupeodes corollae]